MKIAYLSNSSLGKHAANAVHIMNMCAAFADLGHQVTLFAKCNHSSDTSLLCKEFGVPHIFTIKGVKLGNIKIVSAVIYIIIQAFRVIFIHRPSFAYARCIYITSAALLFGIKLIIEFHEMPYNIIERLLYKYISNHKRTIRIVFNSHGLFNDMCAVFPEVQKKNWLIAHNGASIYKYKHMVQLLNKGKGLQIGYSGGLREGNGIKMILDLVKALPNDTFHIIGGNDSQIKYWKSFSNSSTNININWYGYQLPCNIASFLNQCDILLAPYQTGAKTNMGHDTSRWMSPLKIFEYMASGKAMIVSDYPVLREVLTEDTAIIIEPENRDKWINAVEQLRNNSYRTQIGQNALALLKEKYTWQKRAEKVLDQIRI